MASVLKALQTNRETSSHCLPIGPCGRRVRRGGVAKPVGRRTAEVTWGGGCRRAGVGAVGRYLERLGEGAAVLLAFKFGD